MNNNIEQSYRRIQNYRLPQYKKNKNKDFIFFSALTDNEHIVSYISLERDTNNDIMYQKYINLSNDEYHGFLIQLHLLNINSKNFKKEFWINYISNTKLKRQSHLSHKSTYLIASILLIKNSRKFLPVLNQNHSKYSKQKIKILRYLSYLVLKNIKFSDIVNINIVSSCVLFLYNIRNFNDIDINIKYGSSKNFKTTHFKEKMDSIGIRLKKKFNIDLDLLYSIEDKEKNTIKPDYEQFLKWYSKPKLAKYFYNKYTNNYTFKKFNVKYESQISYNPNNYFYFLGLKFSSLEYEFSRRYESLTQINLRKYCHAKRFAEIIYLKIHKLIECKIPFYTPDFNDKCFSVTQKYYYDFFKQHIDIKTIKKYYNKIKGKTYYIKINPKLTLKYSRKKTKKRHRKIKHRTRKYGKNIK